jgi:hypothetical protein
MTRRATRAAAGLVIFFASLPLQWQTLASTPLGALRWFHVGALSLLVLAPPTTRSLAEIRARTRPITGALVVLTLMLLAAAVSYGATSQLQPVQHFVYVLLAICIGSALLTVVADHQARRVAAWSGPVALLSFVLMFGRTLDSAGIGPTVVVSGLVSADPASAFIRFFRVTFHSVSQVEAVNTRHEMFAALIVASCVSFICRPSGRLRVVVNASMVVVAIATLFSLSRAVILAGCLPVALATLRSVLRNRVSLYALALIGIVLAVSPVAIPPIWTLLTQRFTEDTGSYDARLAAIADGTSGDFVGRLLFGGGDLGRSTHTMVLDATLRGGVIAGLAALIVIGVFLRHIIRAARAFMDSGDMATLAAFGAGSLALVRAFTGGGGLLHLVEWSGVAAMVVAEIARQRRFGCADDSAAPTTSGPTKSDLGRRRTHDARD